MKIFLIKIFFEKSSRSTTRSKSFSKRFRIHRRRGIMEIVFSEGEESFRWGKTEKAARRFPRQDCNWAGDVKIPTVISLAPQSQQESGGITIPITTHHFYMVRNYGKQDKRN